MIVVVVVMAVVADALIQVIGIDGDLDHVQLVAVQIDDEQAHAVAFGMHEDQGLLAVLSRRVFRRSPRWRLVSRMIRSQPWPELFLDHAVQLVAVDRCGEMFELRNVQVADAFVRRLA